jgi:hypothetical protein
MRDRPLIHALAPAQAATSVRLVVVLLQVQQLSVTTFLALMRRCGRCRLVLSRQQFPHRLRQTPTFALWLEYRLTTMTGTF